MKFKALRTISTKEFVHLEYGQIYTGEYPLVMSMDATMDDIKMMYPGVDFSDIELIEYEFNEVLR